MAAGTAELMPDEVVERGKTLYEQGIRAQIEPDNIEKLLMSDVRTGHWVMGEDRIEMARRCGRKTRTHRIMECGSGTRQPRKSAHGRFRALSKERNHNDRAVFTKLRVCFECADFEHRR